MDHLPAQGWLLPTSQTTLSATPGAASLAWEDALGGSVLFWREYFVWRQTVVINDLWYFFLFCSDEMNGVFRSHLCTYRLNRAWRITWGWWDEWRDALQTQNTRSEAEHATSRTRRLRTILNPYEWAGEKLFFFETWMPEWGSNPRSPTFQTGSFNHCTWVPSPKYYRVISATCESGIYNSLILRYSLNSLSF